MKNLDRRTFLQSAGTVAATSMFPFSTRSFRDKQARKKLAMVGTGGRGIGMWGTSVQREYSDIIEFVGLCDINPGRVAYAKKVMQVDCPVFTDFDKMLRETKPDVLIVTTTDATHAEYIIKGLESGLTVISEKPLVIDEKQCEAVLEAEKRTGNKVIVTFNARYGDTVQKIWEILRAGDIGEIKSADLNWYLDTDHGASYFRRWHGLRDTSGTLLVHKATHHFDMMNYWIDSEPEEVFAYGSLDYYGIKNSPISHTHCRTCPHQRQCNFFWDIKKDEGAMRLYVNNEKHDGYLRDGCVFRKEIDIYDKMAVQYKYANGVTVSYSLNAFLPYEGYRIAINGTRGRLEAGVATNTDADTRASDEIRVMNLFGAVKTHKVLPASGGHGGADPKLKDRIFRHPDAPDEFRQSSGSRDGAMSALIGIAARKSIETGQIVRIQDLTTLKPRAQKA